MPRTARADLIREMGVFCAAYHFDSAKLMQEIILHWPDATAEEVDLAMRAGGQFFQGGEDE